MRSRTPGIGQKLGSAAGGSLLVLLAAAGGSLLAALLALDVEGADRGLHEGELLAVLAGHGILLESDRCEVGEGVGDLPGAPDQQQGGACSSCLRQQGGACSRPLLLSILRVRTESFTRASFLLFWRVIGYLLEAGNGWKVDYGCNV
jgi:hypothetical protein